MSKHLQGILSLVTKTSNDITALVLSDPSNLNTIIDLFKEYKDRVERFTEAYNEEFANIPTEDSDKRESHRDWFNDKMETVDNYINNITKWIDRSSNKVEDKVSPEDSISNAPSKSSSALDEAKAKKAELEIKMKHLIEIRQLEDEKRKLSQKIEDIELRSEIEKVDNIVLDNSTHNIQIETNPLSQILKNQNEVIQVLVKNQERLFLPKKDLETFDGNDPTKFKPFIQSFERLVDSRCDNDADRLYYLEQFTNLKPKEIVKSCTHMDVSKGYRTAKELLYKKYGDEYAIANAFINKIDTWPTIKSEDAQSLDNFSTYLISCSNYMEDISSLNQLNSPKQLQSIVYKLPYKMRDKWRYSVDRILESGKIICFQDLVNFIEKEARALNRPIFGQISDERSNKISFEKPHPKKQITLVTSSQRKVHDTLACTFCKKRGHKLIDCFSFKARPNFEKIEYVKKNSLCFGCLNEGHKSFTCNKKAKCNICEKPHPTCLHLEIPKKQTTSGNSESQQPKNRNQSNITPIDAGSKENYIETKTFTTAREEKRQISIPLIPVKVKVKGKDNFIVTYATLDNCSTDCFITENLMNQLGISGNSVEIRLSTIEKIGSKSISTIINDLVIMDSDENERIDIPVLYSRKELPISKDDIIQRKDIEQWSHLKDVPFEFVDAEVGLLLGANVSEALKPLEVIYGEENEPYATRHKLGWTLNGPLSRKTKGDMKANRIKVDIEEQIRQLYNQEFSDTNAIGVGPSIDDLKWEKKVEEVKLRPDQHYEIPLPFKDDTPEFPNNLFQATQRLDSIKRKCLKDEKFLSDYAGFMDQMIQNDFMEKIPNEEINTEKGKVWYLVHHAVYHKVKKKIRVVFDCSLKFKGTSLNDKLLQGPDLANSTLGVLLRFRYGDVAVMADIEKMFYQVKVPSKHSDFLRLLWYPENNLEAEPVPYRLKVHVFGAVSSPSCANFALRKIAIDNANTSFQQESLDTLCNNFYVDDLLMSTDLEEEATNRFKEVSQLCSSGGFNLTQVISNSQQVLDSIPQDKLSKTINELNLNFEFPQQHALGLVWNLKKDTFNSRLNIDDQPSTRRGILSVIFSVYDPFGFLGPAVLPAKFIFQNLCRSKLDWDEKIPIEFEEIWKNWIHDLPLLIDYHIKRCFKSYEFKGSRCQLHIFGDGSEVGYGAVAYVRFEKENGDIYCAILMAKSRLAPLKKLTIPRLELSAAQLVVTIRNILKRELNIVFDNEYFWSDSVTVLKYIGNDTKRFQRFVSNRVAFIREHTTPTQWHYVPSKLNPADCASRGLPIKQFLEQHTWKTGPEFLWKSEKHWPIISVDKQLEEDDPEVKSIKEEKAHDMVCNITIETKPDPFQKLIDSSSSWYKLKCKLAWILKVKAFLRNKTLSKSLTLDDFQNAEKEIIRYEQNKAFGETIQLLKKGQCVSKKSPLRKLCPMIDENGLLRVGGRTDKAKTSYSAKHPIIIPKCSHVGQLIAQTAHVEVGHLGREATMSQIRQKYWIVGLNTFVRCLLKKCVACRKREGKTNEQIMANLPEERVVGDSPPFTNVGVDYFGPFYVTRGRSLEKRYGVIFTCLESRATHIEVAVSLDVTAFINVLRRLIARRGQVKIIRSDNGTNLTGSDKELKKSIQDWNQQKIERSMIQSNIQWIFNPPTASHFGGIWERQIRTIRKLLSALTNEQPIKFTDDLLNTLMCEIEAILNGRPLSNVSDDPNDLEALTPNHILHQRSEPTFPPGVFSKEDNYTKRRWRQVQYLADLFWIRWKREYLCSLNQRQKWTKVCQSAKIGDLVLVSDYMLPRNRWPLGRIKELRKSSDGYIRTVVLKTISGDLIRPIHKLVWLNI